MSAVVDTSSVAPDEQFDYWCDVASQLFPPLRIRRDSTGSFHAVSRMHELCGIAVAHTISDPSVIRRTRRCIAQDDPESLTLVLTISGHSLVSQDGRSSLCGPGDITLCDSSRPYSAASREATDVLTVALPKSLVTRDAERLARRSAVRVGGDSARGRLAGAFFTELAAGLGRGEIDAAELELADCVRNLALSLFVPAPRPLPRADLLLQAKAFIDDHLADPRLDADTVARAHFVSRRYLYKLFEPEKTGVREWIQSRRLDRCRRDLADGALRHETVFGIAVRWGFRNAAHFSRSFREAYGVSPRAYRQAVLEGAPVA